MLPTVSGAQCVRALKLAGFQVDLHGPDHVMAKLHGVPIVRVPLVDELSSAQMATILGLTSSLRGSSRSRAASRRSKLFFNEAKLDPSKWEPARQAYLKVVSSPPPANAAHAYAWYKLALVFLKLGEKPHADDALRKALDSASLFPPDLGRVGDAARALLGNAAPARDASP
jgi:tetratricopeptide (TPR) repeat protein